MEDADRSARNKVAMERERNATPEMKAARQAYLDTVILRKAAEITWRRAVRAADTAELEYRRLWPVL